ncbi:hypothetical protein B0H21DRAFT_575532 [Amylocystis lapponica]|nr:hypothetical protein B0H21DRAFT_575532 [Amylocystis lapponica]
MPLRARLPTRVHRWLCLVSPRQLKTHANESTRPCPRTLADRACFAQHDIDVLIEGQPDVLKLRDQIRELDKHFAEFGLKFYFVQDLRTDLEGHELLAIRRDNVLIETLEAGKLGLPKVAKPLFPVSVEEGAFSLFILHPAVLILTKLKRWAMNCDSTRPKTVLKCRSDEQDLRYIVNLLVDRKLTINFDDYEGKPRPQLLAYVRKYRDRFLEDEMLMEALQSAMQPQDWVDMAALQVEESDNMPPA